MGAGGGGVLPAAAAASRTACSSISRLFATLPSVLSSLRPASETAGGAAPIPLPPLSARTLSMKPDFSAAHAAFPSSNCTTDGDLDVREAP